MSSQAHTTYKIVLIGDTGVGKTSLITKHYTRDYDCNLASTAITRTNLDFITSIGKVTFTVIDTCGNHKSLGTNELAYDEADGAIIMFDVTNHRTYKSVSQYCRDLLLKPDMPVVVCGNKVDCIHRRVQPSSITIPAKFGHEYYDISVRGAYNIVEPFMSLLRKIKSDESIQYIDAWV